MSEEVRGTEFEGVGVLGFWTQINAEER